ncbi:MAG: hypothetical protein RLZ32_2665 [Gemmatimonadota bacterium]|jgi:hypothetical protein
MRRPLALLTLVAAPLLAAPLLAARGIGAFTSGMSARGAPGRGPSTDSGATVRGLVHDSLSGLPLVGASVQLVSRDRARPFGATAVTDAAGAFAFADVADGDYTLGFFHPLLDTLGVEAPAQPLRVRDARADRAVLSVPSAATLHTAVCGPSPHPERGVLVMGLVQHAATGAAMEGAAVRGEWLEFRLGNGGLTRTIGQRVVTAGASGWYALCGVPAPGTVVLQALTGPDSTDRLEVELPESGVVRQPLLLGPAHPPAGAAMVLATGTVRTGSNGRPLANALVTVAGRTARTDERGQWRLTDAPAGTRTLEVRAVGYFPVRQVVQVVADAPPIQVALVTLRSVLDTVKVLANYNRYSQLQEFSQRARSGMGRFLTAEQIAQRVPVVTSDLFTAIPGVYLEQGAMGPMLTMKGVFADRCTPAVYLNGFHLGATSLTDIDMLVKPEALLGVEVYAAGFVPPQFEPGMSGCGSLVFWTR